MGYGHLRAALPLCEVLGVPLVEADRAPVASPEEQRRWLAARHWYERTSRGTQLPLLGPLVQRALDGLTAIQPLHPYRDLSRPDRAARALHAMVRGGLGHGLARHLDATGARLLTTYFSAAHSADLHGSGPVDCVVTDADIARAWAPFDPAGSRIRYFAPTLRAVRRLMAYGIPRERVACTGFPLPPSLLGGPDLPALRSNLAARLVRLDPSGFFRESRRHELEAAVGPLPADQEGRPPHLVFAVGGAGAQARLAERFLPSLAPLLRAGRLRLTLVAGVRHDVAAIFERAVERSGLQRHGVAILHASDFAAYYASFNATLADTDILWTKPSELTFYGALGLPLVLGPPVGVHEDYNRRHARERGAGLKQRDARHAGQWLVEWLEEGVLAAAAWAGHLMLPARGTYRIAEIVSASLEVDAATPASPRSTSTSQVLPA
jgi:hypothetical protein